MTAALAARSTCPHCGRSILLRSDGRLRGHQRGPGDRGWCQGANLIPAAHALDAHVQRIVDCAALLTAAQRERLAQLLLNPGSLASAGTGAA